jgi:spore coat protein U-like protein
MNKRLLLLPLLLPVGIDPAPAATATANLSVTATVSPSCIVSTVPVAFGAYDPSATLATDTSGSVSVTCTVGTAYSIALDAGENPATPGNAATRRMLANGSSHLGYVLYLDAAHATIWGDGNNGTSVNPIAASHTGDGTAQSHTVYGRIPAGQYVEAGAYADMVIATITYN